MLKERCVLAYEPAAQITDGDTAVPVIDNIFCFCYTFCITQYITVTFIFCHTISDKEESDEIFE